MSSSRHRRDSDARRDSNDDYEYQRRDSYQRNGYEDDYRRSRDRDGYEPRDYYDDKPRSNDRRHRSPDDKGPRRSSHHDHKDKDDSINSKAIDKVKHSFGASEESYVATGVGAVAGAFLGSEATKGKKNGPVATILGAVLGGLSANAIDKQYELRKEKKKEEERRHSKDDNYGRDDDYRR